PLAACAAPADPPATPGGSSPAAASPEADTPEARARAAGLSAEQAREIASIRAPIALPAHMNGWTVDRVVIDEPMMGDAPMGLVSTSVRWRRGDGACAEIHSSNDGLGGPDLPILSATVRLSQMPGAPEATVHKAADDPAATSAQSWGPGTVVSDYVEVGDEAESLAIWLISNDDGGCRPLALEEAAGILARLRPLRDGGAAPGGSASRDPLDDPALGRFASDDGITGDAIQVETPEQAVALYYEEAEGPIEIQTLAPGRILVTQTGLADDSVRDLRTLFVFERRGGTWAFIAAGTQTRCWQGRGHQDWRAARCL
ncbi:MAG: hypothetical protein AAFQ43_10485, partial [Bacteroidota bacterium]